MANEISTRVQSAALRAATSSPESIALRRISLGTVNIPGRSQTKYLAGGLKLTGDERARIDAKLTELKAVAIAPQTAQAMQDRLAVIAKMLLAHPTGNATAEAVRARAEAYMDALSDVPAWLIAETVARWNRGECGAGHNYNFAPSPATLRELSRVPLATALDFISHLEQVLSARTLQEVMADDKRGDASFELSSGRVVNFGLRRA